MKNVDFHKKRMKISFVKCEEICKIFGRSINCQIESFETTIKSRKYEGKFYMKILFLDLDTLRPDHLGCYGYARNTSPRIDSIAAEGVRFNDYYCSDAPCLPSRSALMSGRFGIHTGVINHGGTAADQRLEGIDRVMQSSCERYSLPAVMRRFGFDTALISPFAERHSAYWFYAGFKEIHNTGKRGLESAEEVFPTIESWLRRNGSRDNWYLHVNLWDAHTPCRVPLAYGNPFEDEPVPVDWVTDEVLAAHMQRSGPHTALDQDKFYAGTHAADFPRIPNQISNMAEWRQQMDAYDVGVRYMDDHVGRLLDLLREENGGTLDDVAIIVTADHGETLGEMGIYADHATADEYITHIPMIIKWPGADKGAASDGLHYNVDLIPTLIELLGGLPPLRNRVRVTGVPGPYEYDGQSFAPALYGEAETGRDYLVLSQCAHVCQRSVRFRNWLYIRTYHDGYYLFDDELLFDLANDPHETTNLADERPEVVHEAAYLMERWHTEQMMKMRRYSAVDPLWTVMGEGGPYHAKGHGEENHIEAYYQRLLDTGRIAAAVKLREKHPEDFMI